MSTLLHTIQMKLDTDEIPWQAAVLGIGVAVTAFEGWIGSRQRPYFSPVHHPYIPASLQPYLPASKSHDTYLKSQSYASDKLTFRSCSSLIDTLESYLLLSSALAPVWTALGLGPAEQGTFPYLGGRWTLLSGFWDLAKRCPGVGQGEIKRSLAFVAIMSVVSTVLSVPKGWYKNFVLEEKHGFNKMTKKTFIEDLVKSFVLGLALELPIIAGVLAIIRWAGQDAIFQIVQYLMLFIFTIQIIMIPLYPYLIAPLFNKFTPLPEDSPIFPKVKELAERLDFPLGRVWMMDGSKRSAHSNAFFFGLPYLTKHIVIYDTLMEKSTPEEIQAVLAHELGHWKGNHVPILLLTGLLQTAFSLGTFSLFLSNKPLLASFGIDTSSPATILSLFLAASLFTPLSAALQFATNSITRALEYNADRFAVKLGKAYAINLKGALVRIHEENLAIYGVDWIYSSWNNNHPTLIERLEALDEHLGEDGKEEKKVEAKKDL
ncbi:hypothetical protein MNV49_007142 [Pseudohyphozyma bogoriensis]|nr:hypothetical protein MNV49_007142 [Pseudohyphozyma bogoriensis]